MIPDAVLDDLRARVPVSAVVGKFVKLTRAGPEWKALSPFRKERTPSFFANDRKGFFYDFGSGEHGDIFEFVMKMEGLDFPEAVKRCAEMAGDAEPKSALPARSASRGESRLSNSARRDGSGRSASRSSAALRKPICARAPITARSLRRSRFSRPAETIRRH
jgi:DNA primase